MKLTTHWGKQDDLADEVLRVRAQLETSHKEFYDMSVSYSEVPTSVYMLLLYILLCVCVFTSHFPLCSSLIKARAKADRLSREIDALRR